MSSVMKVIRRICLEQGKNIGSCLGCPFHSVSKCKLAVVPAEWDLNEVWDALRTLRNQQKHPLTNPLRH